MNAMPMMQPMASTASMPMMNAPGAMPTAMMMPMMCRMTCAMTARGMECTMMPGEGAAPAMMQAMCAMLGAAMANGTPCMMTCAGMPMMSCCGMAMMPAMSCEMRGGNMCCTMMPTGAMSMDMLATCCETMNRMLACGMPMTMTCGGMPMMVCTR